MSKIVTERQNHLLLIKINRPEKRNAFDVDTFLELALAYGELHHNPDLWCGVLYAEGEHFTAGLELDQWAPIMATGNYPELPEGALDPFAITTSRPMKPLVMAIQGTCLTVGIELMLVTDIRIAASNTVFGQIEIQRGIYPIGGATIRLPREVGWSNAMRYLLTGDRFDAAEAYRLGLVQAVVEPGQQLPHALELAERIAEQAPLGVAATLESATNAVFAGETAEAGQLFTRLMPLLSSHDAQEGIMSFLERRKANFQGR